jgi:energy-coupling factor transporter ATP-binding protein EcfA2
LIDIINLYYQYPNTSFVLNDISLKIGSREIIALMGPNGAGKTTLVKHFNGLLKPTSGNIFVDNMNTKNYSIAELSRKVGFVFQNADHQLFSESVEKEIQFTLKNLGFEQNTNEIVEETLEKFELKKYRTRSPFSLSGGERKRVALASVLCANPKYIILDEPTTGQDAFQKEKLIDLIHNLNKDGKAVIVISHDIEFIVDLNPRLITINEGKIISDGQPDEVLTNKESLNYSSLIPPQLTSLSWRLSKNINFPPNILTVNEFVIALKKIFWKR